MIVNRSPFIRRYSLIVFVYVAILVLTAGLPSSAALKLTGPEELLVAIP